MSQTAGWIKTWRSLRHNPVLRGDAATGLLFRWLIEAAAWKTTPWDVAGEVIELQPGQFFASWNRIAEATGLSRKQVRRAAEKLEKADMIDVRPRANRGHILTVCNYSTYQRSEKTEGQPRVQPRARPREQPREPHKKKEEEEKKKERRKKELPSRELAHAMIEAWNRWAGDEGRPTARKQSKLTAKLLLRIDEGMTWDALAVELDRLSNFALGRSPEWNGVTLQWLAKNEENWTKLTGGNYRRPAEKPAEMTVAQRRYAGMAPRKESTR